MGGSTMHLVFALKKRVRALDHAVATLEARTLASDPGPKVQRTVVITPSVGNGESKSSDPKSTKTDTSKDKSMVKINGIREGKSKTKEAQGKGGRRRRKES